MHRFYAPTEHSFGTRTSLSANFVDKSIQLSFAETRHMRDVLRLHEGDEVNVFDGEGREYQCRIEKIEKNSSILKILEEIIPTSPESPLELVLALGLLKGDKLDLVIQKAVELGVSRIQPLFTKRCDVRFAVVKRGKKERWQKIALEAAKQCGRARLTAIGTPLEFESFMISFDSPPSDDDGRILFTERSGKSLPEFKKLKKVTAIVGPEGGWEDSELELAGGCGFSLVTLGARILRAETAAITAAVILQHRFGDMI